MFTSNKMFLVFVYTIQQFIEAYVSLISCIYTLLYTSTLYKKECAHVTALHFCHHNFTHGNLFGLPKLVTPLNNQSLICLRFLIV